MLDHADPATRARRDGRLQPDRLPAHGERLFRAAYALCGTRHDAEDLVQQTYENVLRKPRFLRREDDLGYLMRALRNTYISTESARKRRPQTPVAPEGLEWVVDPRADTTGALLDAKLIFAAIAQLSEPLRLAIVAVDVAGLPYKEAASALQVPTGTIMSRLHRARLQVAQALEAEGHHVGG